MPNPDYFTRRGDFGETIRDTLTDADLNPVDIRDATIRFVLTALAGGDPLIDAEASNDQDESNDPGSTGNVSYEWQEATSNDPADSDHDPGFYLACWRVTYENGSVQTFPNGGFILVEITDPRQAASRDYISLEEIKGTRELSGGNHADADLLRAITAASRAVDAITNRRFYLDKDATSQRRYTGSRAYSLLEIDDLVELTAVALDLDRDGVFETALTVDTGFVLEPLNAAADGKPWTGLRAIRHRWPNHPGAVRVTGRFGWAEVPGPIIQLTSILASRLVQRARQSPFGIIGVAGSDQTVAMRIAYNDPDLLTLVRDYTRDPVLA